MRCPHLTPEFQCDLFSDPRRPEVCASFKPEREVCGHSQQEAMEILHWMEAAV